LRGQMCQSRWWGRLGALRNRLEKACLKVVLDI
jgi:hypothetical protein